MTTKAAQPYTLEELADEFKEGCVCPDPEQHAALAAPNRPDPIYCVRVSDWTRLRATVTALSEANARAGRLEAALREMREYAEEVMEESDEETTGSTALDHFINLALAAPASSPLLAKLKAAKKMVQALEEHYCEHCPGCDTDHGVGFGSDGIRAALRLWKEAGGEG